MKFLPIIALSLIAFAVPANANEFQRECIKNAQGSGHSQSKIKKYCECAEYALETGDTLTNAVKFCRSIL